MLMIGTSRNGKEPLPWGFELIISLAWQMDMFFCFFVFFSKAPISLLLNFGINRARFSCGALVKNPPANAGDERDTGSIPGSGRLSGVGNGNLLQYSCLRNSMHRLTWWAPVPEVLKGHIQPSDWAQHSTTWAHVPWSCNCWDDIPFWG